MAARSAGTLPTALARSPNATFLPSCRLKTPSSKWKSPESCCALRWSTALAHSARKESQADSPKSPACGLRTMRRPAGSRVTAASVNGKPLEDNKTYTLALSAFLLSGGDGYKMFRGARVLVSPEEGPVEFAVVLAALAVAGEIAPHTDGRIERADLARP